MKIVVWVADPGREYATDPMPDKEAECLFRLRRAGHTAAGWVELRDAPVVAYPYDPDDGWAGV